MENPPLLMGKLTINGHFQQLGYIVYQRVLCLFHACLGVTS